MRNQAEPEVDVLHLPQALQQEAEDMDEETSMLKQRVEQLKENGV